MALAVRAALVLVSLAGAGVFAGCVSESDEAAIEEVMREFFDAFQEADSERLAGLFGGLCEDTQENAIAAIAELDTLGEEIQFDLRSVDVRILDEEFAEALPEGSVTIDGQTSPLTTNGEEEEYTLFVKEDGEWRIADCNLFL